LIANHIIPSFGDAEIINEIDVQDFVLSKLKSGLSQKTVKDILIVLKMVLKFGAKRILIDCVPWEIEYPTDHSHTPIRVLTIPEIKQLIKHIKENLCFKSLGILVCLSTGLRIGEVCALAWGDINTDAGV